MGRQQRCRKVGSLPEITYFKPVGIQLSKLEEINLHVEEAEAIRLNDLEDMEQEQSAQRMNISRSTFSRLLDSARRKIADALLNGKSIRINGGNFEMAIRRFRCLNGHEWEVPFETMVSAPPNFCPECQTPSIMPLFAPGTRHHRRHGLTKNIS